MTDEMVAYKEAELEALRALLLRRSRERAEAAAVLDEAAERLQTRTMMIRAVNGRTS